MSPDPFQTYVVYALSHTDSNGKTRYYIGYTAANNVETRRKQHRRKPPTKLRKYITKHNLDFDHDLKMDVLQECATLVEARSAEQALIKQYGTTRSSGGFNTLSGHPGWSSQFRYLQRNGLLPNQQQDDGPAAAAATPAPTQPSNRARDVPVLDIASQQETTSSQQACARRRPAHHRQPTCLARNIRSNAAAPTISTMLHHSNVPPLICALSHAHLPPPWCPTTCASALMMNRTAQAQDDDIIDLISTSDDDISDS